MNAPSRKFSLSRSIAVVLMLFPIGFLLTAVDGIGMFVNIPALLLTGGFVFLLLLGTFGTDFLKFLPDSILTLFSTPSQPIPRYADIARFGSRYAVAGAAIATFISFIQMLNNLSDPSGIGIAMASALAPILYALVLSEVFFAMLYKVYSDGGEPKDSPPLATRTPAIAMIVLGALVASFVVMLMAHGTFEATPHAYLPMP